MFSRRAILQAFGFGAVTAAVGVKPIEISAAVAETEFPLRWVTSASDYRIYPSFVRDVQIVDANTLKLTLDSCETSDEET